MRRFIAPQILLLLTAIGSACQLFDSIDYEPFLPDLENPDVLSWGGSPDDSINLYADQPTGSAYDECLSDGNLDDMSLLGNVARIRARKDACSNPDNSNPDPPYTNIYDSTDILNQLSPVLPKPQIPGTTKEETDIERLNRLYRLDSIDPKANTNTDEQDDVCPKELVGDSQTPVCSSKNYRRDALRAPGWKYYTLYNVEYCKFSTSYLDRCIQIFMIYEIRIHRHRCPLRRNAA